MSDAIPRQIRVLHIVSSGGIPSGLQQTLFMPLLTRMPKQRVKAQVVCLARGVVPSAVLRQSGIPVHDVALSRRGFSLSGFADLLRAARTFHPDIIQAWGHTAQIVSVPLRKRCGFKPRLVWSVAETAPLARDAGFIERRKLRLAARSSSKADRIVYASEAGASQHRRAGFPDGGHTVVPPGVDATRFKSDSAARSKLRGQLQLDPGAFVIGMLAPFRVEYDHATLLKAAGELLKTNPHVAVVLAGHGVQKGNAALMALVGGGALSTRTHLLGERSDVASLCNACDVVCSSALHDGSRMSLVMAMLCGVPCVGTGMGAQGEVIGQYGVAIEPGSPAAFVRSITRVMQLSPDKRAYMTQGARKHALRNYVYVSSLQKYLQLYHELTGRDTLGVVEDPAPRIAASVPVESPAPALPQKEEMAISAPSNPDPPHTERSPQPLPKRRVEQEAQRAKKEAELPRPSAKPSELVDVLQAFEAELAAAGSSPISPMSERARGVAEEMDDLLAPEVLAIPVAPVDATHGPSTPDTAPVAAPRDAGRVPDRRVDGHGAGRDVTADSNPMPDAEPQPDQPELQLELLEEPAQERRRAAP